MVREGWKKERKTNTTQQQVAWATMDEVSNLSKLFGRGDADSKSEANSNIQIAKVFAIRTNKNRSWESAEVLMDIGVH